MFESIKLKLCKAVGAVLSHRILYAALSLSHTWAAISTGKVEVYAPMAILYFLLAR